MPVLKGVFDNKNTLTNKHMVMVLQRVKEYVGDQCGARNVDT